MFFILKKYVCKNDKLIATSSCFVKLEHQVLIFGVKMKTYLFFFRNNLFLLQ